MPLQDAICDLPNEDLLSLFNQVKAQVFAEVKRGGKRISSVTGEGQSTTYDLDGIKPSVAVRIIRNELVKRKCLPAKQVPRMVYDFGPVNRCCSAETTDGCSETTT